MPHRKPPAPSSIALMLIACLAAFAPAQTSAPGAARACDVLIVGGSFGGCAAASALCGLRVVMVEDSRWIGGQVTSQGVSALDEHRWIETFGGTRRYEAFRAAVRAASGGAKNPGGGWVSRLCFLPRTGLAVLEKMTEGTEILLESHVTAAAVEGDRVVRVTVERADGTHQEFAPRFVLEASDLGEFWPIAGIDFHIGAEAQSETHEPHAEAKADPARIQSFTYPFAVERRPGERHVIDRPDGYEALRDAQPFTLTLTDAAGHARPFRFFEAVKGVGGAFFDYRRIAPSIAMINWPGNDARANVMTAEGRAFGKRLALAFLHWLQTECPRDDGGRGYPDLLLRKDVMGTDDGLSMRPYVREGRRLAALTRIVEQDLTPEKTARARLFRDAIGIGHYGIDIHSCVGDPDERRGRWIDAKPFQVPLGALIPKRVTNVLAAGKSIGATHVTNGAYRLHPVEWTIGESAAITARFCLEKNLAPRDLLTHTALLDALQAAISAEGIPIFWATDIPTSDPDFVTLQCGLVRGTIAFDPSSLEVHPIRRNEPATPAPPK